jgi:hypothetical protein
MEGPNGRYARDSEGYTGTDKAANVFGTCVANTILASEHVSRKKAGHLRANDRIKSLLLSWQAGGRPHL